MEPIPSLKIIKYVFYDQFDFEKKIKTKHCSDLHNSIETVLHKYQSSLNRSQQLVNTTFTVFDLETTGFYPKLGDEIVSIGAIKMNVNEMKFSEHFYTVVSPIGDVPEYIFSLTGLSEEEIRQGITFQEAFLKFLEFSKNTILVAHPASFDIHFLEVLAKRWRINHFSPSFIDSYFLANYLMPRQNNKLDSLVSYFQIEEKQRHHALNDAQMTSEIFEKLLLLLKNRGVHSLDDYFQIKGKKKGR